MRRQSCACRPESTSLLAVSLNRTISTISFCQRGLLQLKVPRTACQPALMHSPMGQAGSFQRLSALLILVQGSWVVVM